MTTDHDRDYADKSYLCKRPGWRMVGWAIIAGLLAALILRTIPAAWSAEPVVVEWHGPDGSPVRVLVSERSFPGKTSAVAVSDYVPIGIGFVYLAGNRCAQPHELGHIAGMRHTKWSRGAFGIQCARVTVAGWRTKYRVGELLCVGANGCEWRE